VERRLQHPPAPPSRSAPTLRFGLFDFDPATGELRGPDRVVRLPPQQSRVLSLLASRAGRVVNREEIRREVWGDETFVDLDLGLNLCINKIRLALGDDAREPRYVETLPRRGYRFVAPVEAPPAAPRTLAVLPFDNLNPDQEEEAFAGGVTDAVITELGKTSGVHVLSRQSVLHLKGSHRRLTQIGRDLGVDAVVEGSVLRAGPGVRVTAQLIEVDPERHLWSQEYEGEMKDVLGLQSRLACSIGEHVTARLSVGGPAIAHAKGVADRTDEDEKGKGRQLLAWGAGIVSLVVVSGALAALTLRRPSPPRAIPRVGTFASQEGVELDPTLGPDGKQIAYVWEGAKRDNFDIYVQLVDETRPRRLTTDPAFDFSPVWSPDGVHIAFLRMVPGGVDVRVVPSAGGAERSFHLSRAFCDFPIYVYRRQFCGLAWAPDGRSLTIVDKESPEAPNSLYRFDLESREKRRLTTPPAHWFGDGMSAFSPDGQTLAFARSRSPAPNEVYVLPLGKDGEPADAPRPITHDGRPIFGLDWTADGRSIVFASERGGPAGLWRVGVFGGEPERLGIGSEGAYGVSISRNVSRLVYASSPISINIWRVALPGPRDTVPDARAAPAPFITSPSHDVHLAFSPDGQRVAFVSGRSGDWELWTGDNEGSQLARLTRLAGGALSPEWSPDGRSIVFAFKGWTAEADFQAFVVSAAGGTPRRIVGGDFAEFAPTWSRDGRWIYFASDRGDGCGLWKVAAGGGEPMRVGRECGGPVFEAKDGASFFYGFGGRIMRVPSTGGSPVPVLTTPPRACWTLAESGIFVLDPDAAGGPTIALFSFATGRLKTLATLPGDRARFVWGANGFTVSPDGRSAFYELLDGRDLDIRLAEGFR